MKRLVLAILRLYRLGISALLPTSCRFYPTCSAYSQEAIERYGVAKGLRLTMHRLGRCHPWCKGGYDPVP
jgi:putative membrane protein insertion efficiency factor